MRSHKRLHCCCKPCRSSDSGKRKNKRFMRKFAGWTPSRLHDSRIEAGGFATVAAVIEGGECARFQLVHIFYDRRQYNNLRDRRWSQTAAIVPNLEFWAKAIVGESRAQ